MISRRLIGISSCAFVLSIGASAFADEPLRVDVAPQFYNPTGAVDFGRDVPISEIVSNNNNTTKDATPGVEHMTVTRIVNNGITTLMVLAIRGRTTTETERGDYRSTCSSYTVTKTGLKAVVTGVSLKEKLDGNKSRTFNRPILQATNDPGNNNFAMAFYTSENDTDRPSAWVRAINERCETISDPVRISHNISYTNRDDDDNNNNSDADAGTDSDGGTAAPLLTGNHDAQFTGDYNEGIGGNTAYLGVAADGARVFQTGITRGHNDENVGYVRNIRVVDAPGGQKILSAAGWEWTMYGNLTRQFVLPIQEGAGFAAQTLACGNAASDRNNNERPGRVGVKCYSMQSVDNGNTLSMISNFVVAPMYKDGTGKAFYPNQASGSLVKIDKAAGYAYFTVNSVDSDGMGRNTNTQGSNSARATLAKVALLSHDSNASITAISSVTGTTLAKNAKHSFGVATQSYGPNNQAALAIFSASPTGVTPGALHVLPIKSDMSGFGAYDLKEWTTGISDSGYLSNKLGQNPGDQGRDFPRVYETIDNPGYGQADGFLNMAKTLWVVSYAGQDGQSSKNRGFIALIPASWDSNVDPHPINATPANFAPSTPAAPAPVTPAAPPSDSGGCACSTPGTSTSTSSMLGGLALFGLVLGGMLRRRKA